MGAKKNGVKGTSKPKANKVVRKAANAKAGKRRRRIVVVKATTPAPIKKKVLFCKDCTFRNKEGYCCKTQRHVPKKSSCDHAHV